MSSVTRTWLAFAGLGTGMIHLALVLSSPLPVAIVLAAIGGGEVLWAVVAFRADTFPHPRLVLAGAVVPLLLWAILVAVSGAFGASGLTMSLGFTALGFAAVMQLFVAVTIAVGLRRGVDFATPTRTPTAARYLLGILLGGVAVAMLTTPALAATEAGLYAQPHGHQESGVTTPSHPGH